jgi:hypothetical protein
MEINVRRGRIAWVMEASLSPFSMVQRRIWLSEKEFGKTLTDITSMENYAK